MRAVGPDISHWQGTFKNKGNIDFVIVKATEGWGYVDPEFENFLPEVMTVPIRGAYHYFRTEYDPVAQVENFLEAVTGKGFHFLAVDYEGHNNVLDADGETNLRIFWDEMLFCLQSFWSFSTNLSLFLSIYAKISCIIHQFADMLLSCGEQEER